MTNCYMIGLRKFSLLCLVVLVVVSRVDSSQLTTDFYSESCPQIFDIVSAEVQKAVTAELRMAASLVRLHFHDCFVQGCDGSILLDNTTYDGKFFDTEKDAVPSKNSVRGFEVIDAIKAALEEACPQTVSCAEILAVISMFSSTAVGGPPYVVLFGRRGSFTPNKTAANTFSPSPFDFYKDLITNLKNVGAHTYGRARCRVILTNDSDTINPIYLNYLLNACPATGNGSDLQDLDFNTPDDFDNAYYQNLLNGEGAMRSDHVLASTPGSNVDLAALYALSEYM